MLGALSLDVSSVKTDSPPCDAIGYVTNDNLNSLRDIDESGILPWLSNMQQCFRFKQTLGQLRLHGQHFPRICFRTPARANTRYNGE